MLSYGKQSISEEDISAVTDALRSPLITQGPLVEAFEESVSNYVGAKHAIAVNSATSALYVAYRSLGVDENSLVWTVTNTFVATSNAALLCGATVDFVDIDPETWNISVENLREKLIQGQAIGALPNVVVVVHFAGFPCEMESIWKLSQEFGFLVVEDASHALGAEYKGQKIGGCKFSHAAVFSFHPVKMITTGEGGIITTNSDALAEKAISLRSHGVTRKNENFIQDNEGDWYFEQQDLGHNFRITDFQCALGISQMNRLDSFVEERNQLANQYTEKLADLDIQLPKTSSESKSSWHLFVVRLEPDKARRNLLIAQLRELGIGASMHYIPVPHHPYYRKMGFSLEDYPESQKYFESAITIPLFVGMSSREIDFVFDSLREVLA